MGGMERRFFGGQVQLLSAVILTGIVMFLVGVAYFWGIPLIQKRTAMSEFSSMERFITNLKEKVAEIARSGAGETDLNIRSGNIKLLPYDSGNGNNSLVIEFFLDQPLLFPNTTHYIGATSLEDINKTGIYGEASPSVVSISETKTVTGYKLTAEVIYRELLREDIPKRGYIIALCEQGDSTCTQTPSGDNMIRMFFDKNIVETGKASNGGDLVITYINVKLS